MKFYHACSRNILKYIFSTNINEGITASFTCKTVLRFRDFVPKVCTLDQDGAQFIGHALNDSNNMYMPKS